MTEVFVEGETKVARLSERQKQALYTQYCLGERIEDLAVAYNIGKSTAYAYVKEMRGKGNAMSSKEKVVAGDRKNGRLISCSDPHRFEGTCVINGKAHTKTFTTVNAKKAEEMWRKWCDGLRDERQFLDMVERKTEAKQEQRDEPQAVCGYPGDPVEEITPAPVVEAQPWREIAEERQKRIEELEARVAELEDKERKVSVKDMVIADTELAEPKLAHWFNNNGAFRVVCTDKPVYLLWAKTDEPRCFGVYQHTEQALKELDRLNDVAAFLGSAGAFEVEEVVWR